MSILEILAAFICAIFVAVIFIQCSPFRIKSRSSEYEKAESFLDLEKEIEEEETQSKKESEN